MDNKKHIQEELQRLNSSLTKVDKEQSRALPDNYFDGLENSIMDKIKKTDAAPKVIDFKVKEAPKSLTVGYRKWSIAAGVALLISLAVAIWPSPEMKCDTLACLDDDIIQSYVEDHMDVYEDMILDELDFEYLYEAEPLDDLYLDEIDEATLIEEL
jgi:hypothetical protein